MELQTKDRENDQNKKIIIRFDQNDPMNQKEERIRFILIEQPNCER